MLEKYLNTPNIKLLFSRLRDVLFPNKPHPYSIHKATFPVRIGKFAFVKELSVNKGVNFYRFALYKDAGGKTRFAKAWFGERKNTAYYWLKNEITLFSAFTRAYKDKSIEYKESLFRVPEVYKICERDGCLLIVSKYIPDAKENFVDKELVGLYDDAIKYIRNSGEKLLNSLDKKILTIDPFKVFVSFPLIFIKSLISKPRLWREILTSGYFFIKHGLNLFKFEWKTLVHRDLRGTILRSGKHYYIIDWQTAAISNSMFELAQLFLTYWENSQLSFDIFELKVTQKIFESEKSLNFFKTMCIYVAFVEMGFIKIKSQSDEKTFLQQLINLKKIPNEE